MSSDERALKGAIISAIESAAYLPGTIADKAGRISNDIIYAMDQWRLQAVAAEREAAAKELEEMDETWGRGGIFREAARIIRARGETPT